MATGALVIGWGPAVHGREKHALAVFSEAMQYYARLQQQGEIESFEPVALEAHGGDLNGFLIIRGDRDKLNSLRFSDEFVRLNTRAQAVVHNLGVISAYIGEELQQFFAKIPESIADLS